jgi:hypothetical protein
MGTSNVVEAATSSNSERMACAKPAARTLFRGRPACQGRPFLSDTRVARPTVIPTSLTAGFAGLLLIASLVLAVPSSVLAAEERPVWQVDSLHAAINTYDVAGATAVFTDDAVVIQPRIGGLPQTCVGREQIGQWLRDLAEQHVRWNISGRVERMEAHVHWSDVFSLDAFDNLGLGGVEVESNAVLAQDGRIESLTTVLTPHGARSLQLTPAGPTPLVVPDLPLLGSLVVAAGIVGFGFVAGVATLAVTRRR